MTGWNELADREGFVVVYPEGTSLPLRWNATDAFLVESVDDVQFVRDLITNLSGVTTVDPARIYVTGISNGGAMANRIACEAADLVAAIGMVAAVPTELPGGCAPQRPVPVIAFHGTADPLVRYNGGAHHIPVLGQWMNLEAESITYLPVEVWIAGWAERNECSPTPQDIPATGDARGLRYAGCGDDAEVLLYTIEGGGHTWPGGRAIPLVGKTSRDIDASAVMWEFFQAHPMHSGR